MDKPRDLPIVSGLAPPPINLWRVVRCTYGPNETGPGFKVVTNRTALWRWKLQLKMSQLRFRLDMLRLQYRHFRLDLALFILKSPNKRFPIVAYFLRRDRHD
jgi:hypothetical protein